MRILGDRHPNLPPCRRQVGMATPKSAFGVTPPILLPVNLVRTSTATHTPAARVYIGFLNCLKCCLNSAPHFSQPSLTRKTT